MADNIRISMPVTVNIASAKNQLDAFILLYERRGITLATNISSINNQLREQGTILGSNGQILSSVNRTTDGFVQQGRTIQNTGRQVNGLASSMRNLTMESEQSAQSMSSVLSKIAMWTALTTAVFAPIRLSKDLVNTIYEIDTAIVNLKKVSDELGETVGIKEFTKDMNDMAIAVGHSTTAAINSVTEFKRLGYSLKEAQILGEQALVYSNIGDLDIGDATKSIISTLAGFQLGVEKVNHVMDAYNEVGNNFNSTSAGIGKALQRSSSALYEANNTLEQSIGLIIAGNSSVQNVEKVGNGLKTVAMRIRGVSEETGEAIPQLDGLVKRLTGVDMMKDENTFKSTYDIMVEISKVWNNLEDVSQATLLDKLFGKHQGAVGASILNNMSVGIKATETAMNSLGSSAKEQSAYMDSLQAKVSEFKETATNLYIDTISPETLKSVVEFGTKTVDLVDKVGLLNIGIIGLYLTLGATGKITAFNATIRATAVALAYTGQATEIATRQTINYGAYSTIATRQLHNNIITLRASALATNALSVAVRGLKLAFMTLWPLVLIEGAILLYQHFKKIEKQAESTRKAFNQFNIDLKEFEDTLDPTKIDDVTASLVKLKESVNYEDSLKSIDDLKKQINSLGDSETEASMLPELEKQLSNLENKIALVTNAQKKYDEQKKIAIALDYQSVQEGNNKIALKIRENEANKQLIDSYQKVHDKMVQGNELTQEENDLNQKLIDKYPEYTKVLNDKTSAVGVNIEALKANQTAEEALAIVSFNSMKSKAEASSIETDTIIKNTEARILAIQAEIDAITKRDLKVSKSDSDRANASNLQLAKLKTLTAAQVTTQMLNNEILKNTVTGGMQVDLGNAWEQLNRAKQTKGAWDTLANMNIEDLQKGVPKFKGSSDSEGKDKDSSKDKTQIESTTDALIRLINQESLLQKAKSDTINTELSQIKSSKDYQKQLELTTSLLSSQQKEVELLSTAKSKLETEFAKTSSSSGFTNTSLWLDFTGEKSLTYLDAYNSSSKTVQESMDKTFDSLQKLRNAWVSNSEAMKSNVVQMLQLSRDSNISSLQLNQDKIITSLKNLINPVELFDNAKLQDEIDIISYELNKANSIFPNGIPIADTSPQAMQNLSAYKQSLNDIINQVKAFGSTGYNIGDPIGEQVSQIENTIKAEIEYAQKLKSELDSTNNIIRDKTLLYKQQEDQLERNIKTTSDAYDAQIKQQQELLKNLDDQINKEDRLAKMKEINDNLAKTMADKRFSYINADGTEELTFDKTKVAELIKDRDDLTLQYKNEDERKAIQDRIESLQTAKDTTVKVLQDQLAQTQAINAQSIQSMQLYANNLSTLYQKVNTDVSTKIDQLKILQDKQVVNETTKWNDTITAVQNGTKSYTELLSGTDGNGGWFKTTLDSATNFSDSIQVQINRMAEYISTLARLQAQASAMGGGTTNTNTPAYTPLPTFNGIPYQSFDDGGIVGQQPPNRIVQLANKFFNSQLSPGQILTQSLINEIQIPPQNLLKYFVPNMQNFANQVFSLGANKNQQPLQQKLITINVDKIVTESPTSFLQQIDHLILANT